MFTSGPGVKSRESLSVSPASAGQGFDQIRLALALIGPNRLSIFHAQHFHAQWKNSSQEDEVLSVSRGADAQANVQAGYSLNSTTPNIWW